MYLKLANVKINTYLARILPLENHEPGYVVELYFIPMVDLIHK